MKTTKAFLIKGLCSPILAEILSSNHQISLLPAHHGPGPGVNPTHHPRLNIYTSVICHPKLMGTFLPSTYLVMRLYLNWNLPHL